MSGIHKLLPRKTKIEVWSNIDPYAVQSAAIIADELGVKSKYVNAIGHEDIAELLAVVEGHAKGKCLIVVGEQPYLGNLASSMANVNLPFKPYFAAGFSANNPDHVSAELLWAGSLDLLINR